MWRKLGWVTLSVLGIGGCEGTQRSFTGSLRPDRDAGAAGSTPAGNVSGPNGERSPGEIAVAPTALDDMLGAASDAGIQNVECTIGASECTSATEQRECDTDGHWAAPVICMPACIGDRCGGECAPNSTECVSPVQFRACSSDGVWSAPEECEAACVDNACAGECKPHDTKCVSATEVQTCTDQGVWAASTPCTNACVDRACTGECVPSSTRCPSATQLQACNALGQWQTPEPCPLACVGDACGGECAPNARRCHPETGVPQLCSAAGAWRDQQACLFLCVGNGTCGGECVPNDRRCNPATGIPQLCSAGGTWQNQPSCQFVCQDGFCGGDCRPNSRRCDPQTGVPQICGGAGTFQNQTACLTGEICSVGDCVCQSTASDCGNGCFDLNTNANNCGVCGHSCQGQTCTGGACTPTVLTTGQFVQGGLALAGDSVFFSVAAEIRRIGKTGGTVQTLIPAAVPGDTGVSGLVADGTQLYWGVSQFSPQVRVVRRLDTTVTGAAQITFGSGAANVVRVTGGFVYWNDPSGTVNSYLRAATTAATPVVGGAFASTATSNLFVAANNCVYTRLTTPDTRTITAVRTIRRVCTSGSSAEVYVAPAGAGADLTTGNIRAMAADGTGVYFSEQGRGIKRMTLDTDTPEITTIVPSTTIPREIVLDGNFIYFVDGSDAVMNCTTNWTLNRVLKAGGAVTPIVKAPIDCPSFLATDSTHLYWANTGNNTGVLGSINRVPK